MMVELVVMKLMVKIGVIVTRVPFMEYQLLPCTILSTLYVVICLIHFNLMSEVADIIPILKMMKLRHRGIAICDQRRHS